ncbi:CAP domain-containing protein [Dactylosporangium sp. CA-052675]|uniref:CAP domain-containing protein n=1 Tax=Dactylosporangium sp. CA-052675 TaxID=3239927 RepID=UPI003D8E82D1
MSAYGDGYADRYDPYSEPYNEPYSEPSSGRGHQQQRSGGFYSDEPRGYAGGYGSEPGRYGSEPGRYGSEPGRYGSEPGGYAGAHGPDQDESRRGKRMLLVAAIGAVALVVVGAVAFGGSLLLSKSSNASPQSNLAAGAAATTEAGDLFAGASGDPSAAGSSAPAENASTAPAPTTKAPATTAAAPKPTTKKPTTAAGGGSNVAYENQVLAIVNTERAKAGCQPLAYNAKLRAAAYKHSADMAAKDYFSHDSQDGTSFATRILNEGYRWSNAAENIAKGQRTPEEVMKSWMDSSGHRANILNCKLKDLGVGLAYQGKTAIWTQDFGTQG